MEKEPLGSFSYFSDIIIPDKIKIVIQRLMGGRNVL